MDEADAAEGPRNLLTPKWIAGHLLVVVVVPLFVALGLWQLHRHDERRDRNALVTERQDEPVSDVATLVPVDAGDDAAAGVRFRRAEAVGRYLVADEVLVRNRSFDGQAGSWVLTPLDLGDGTAVVVNRGWVPVTGGDDLPAAAAAPSGEVRVEGVVETSQERGRFGPTDPDGERLDTLSRVDLDRLQDQVDIELYPVWIQAQSGTGTAEGADLPAVVEPEALSDGPHLGYAVQWFLFTGVVVVGYPLLLRRARRS